MVCILLLGILVVFAILLTLECLRMLLEFIENVQKFVNGKMSRTVFLHEIFGLNHNIFVIVGREVYRFLYRLVTDK